MKSALNIRSVRLWFLIGVEYLKRRSQTAFLIVFTLLALVFIQFKYHLFYNSNFISLGLIGTYQQHDIPLEVTKLISQGLVETDENGRIKSKLVSGWEVNNDATIFKFKLRDNLKWIDGTTLQSTDLEFPIPNIRVEYPDERTIKFTLKESYSPFPSLLTKPIIKKGSMIGVGPYKITKLEKSKIFITKIELKPLGSNLPTVYIRFYPNEKVAKTGFDLGEVQAVLGLSKITDFKGNPKVAFWQKTDYTKIVTILFQTKDALLSNRSLRQALSFIAPKIADEEPANNPYPPKNWAYNSDSKKYLANSQEARSALERSKGSMPQDRLKAELILTATPNLEDVGKKIIKHWKGLGLNAKLRIESGIAQNFQSLLITQSIPLDPDQYFLWHATQVKTNLTKYDSKRADKDLEDGRKIITEEDRKNKYYDFQKTLLEDAPAVFLYFPKFNIVYLKKVENNLNKILVLTKN